MNMADLFNQATTITRGSTSTMADGFKVYQDKVAIKHPTLQGGENVLVKVSSKGLIFIKSEKGNRKLTSKGTDGRVMLSLNEQMKKAMAKTFKAHKNGNTCDTLELELVKENNLTYYVLSTDAKTVEVA